MSDRVPKSFFGTWRVESTIVDTNSQSLFRKSSVDLWNLSKQGDVITLENPFSGAHASIIVKEASDKTIKFQKEGYEDNQKMIDVVELRLAGETFSGVNYLTIQTLSKEDKNLVIKTQKATYSLRGEKISGSNVIK